MPDVTPPRARYSLAEFVDTYGRETEANEFKRSTSSAPLQEAFVAMSNTRGGVIWVGIEDDGSIRGRALDPGVEEAINEAALAAHDVGRYSIHEVEVDQRRVTAICVQRRSEGFSQTSNGRALVRRGPRNHALIGADLQDFINRRALRRFEQTDSGLAISDADANVYDVVRERFGWPHDGGPSTDRLEERGLARGGSLTIAGALVLTRPEASLRLSKAIIEVRRFPDDSTEYDRREVFGGPLQEQVSQASRFVSSELGSDLVVSGLYRYDIPRLPEVVVREAIANAVAHRNYEIDRSCVIVELRPDRVVVTSPGGLPEPVTVSTIRVAQASRNPSIINTLRAFSLAEDAGRGIDVMEDSMRAALLDPPIFQDLGNAVVATLPLRGPITSRERAWIQDLERQGEIGGDDRLLVVHAARGEVLTNSVAREVLGTEDRAVALRALQRLRDAGLLVQSGERGAASYRLAERIAPPAAYRMNPRQLGQLVVETAQDHMVTNEEVRALTGLDRRQALALLQQLIRDGSLVQHGQRRGTRYSAS